MDTAGDLYSYGGEQVNQIDTSGNVDIDPDRPSNCCEHCCHVHVVGFVSQVLASTAYSGVADYQPGTTPYVLIHAQAPPTPPPNA